MIAITANLSGRKTGKYIRPVTKLAKRNTIVQFGPKMKLSVMFVAHDPQLKTRRETHAQCLTHYFQKQYCFPSLLTICCIMAWSMLFNSLFYILTIQCATAQSSSFRGNFIPPETTATLLEGDILVPESQVGRGPEELDACLKDPELLWPNGYVPYCFETFE